MNPAVKRITGFSTSSSTVSIRPGLRQAGATNIDRVHQRAFRRMPGDLHYRASRERTRYSPLHCGGVPGDRRRALGRAGLQAKLLTSAVCLSYSWLIECFEMLILS